MERAILLMFLSVSAVVAGPAEPLPEISYQRLQVVTPANPGQSYQSFSKSLEAYSVRTIMFMYPKDRLIVQYQFITVSGAGNVRHIAGGRESNFLTIRAENSGARVFNYMVNIYTVQVATTTESLTTTTTTTTESGEISEPDPDEGDDTAESGSPEEDNENSPEADDDNEGSGSPEEDNENSPDEDDGNEGSGSPEEDNENSPDEDDDNEGSGLPEEDNENSPEAEGPGTTPGIPTTTCVCTCG